MNIQIITPEEAEELQKEFYRQDWTKFYEAIEETGHVVISNPPKSFRSTLSSHYRKSRRKAHVVSREDGTFYIYLE